MPVFYKDVMLDCGYRVDLVVEGQVIVEIKSVASFAPIHEAQLLSYLKLSDCKNPQGRYSTNESLIILCELCGLCG